MASRRRPCRLNAIPMLAYASGSPGLIFTASWYSRTASSSRPSCARTLPRFLCASASRGLMAKLDAGAWHLSLAALPAERCRGCPGLGRRRDRWDRLSKVGGGLHEITLLREGDAQVVVRRAVAGLQHKRLPEVIHRARDFAAAEQEHPKVVVGDRGGGGGERVAPQGARIVPHARLPPGERAETARDREGGHRETPSAAPERVARFLSPTIPPGLRLPTAPN